LSGSSMTKVGAGAARAAIAERERPSGGVEERRARHRTHRSGPLVTGGIMVAPAAAVLLVFWAAPLVLVMGFSFFHWTDGTRPRFVGVGEYRLVLSSHLFWHSVGITLVFAAGTVAVGTLIS